MKKTVVMGFQVSIFASRQERALKIFNHFMSLFFLKNYPSVSGTQDDVNIYTERESNEKGRYQRDR